MNSDSRSVSPGSNDQADESTYHPASAPAVTASDGGTRRQRSPVARTTRPPAATMAYTATTVLSSASGSR